MCCKIIYILIFCKLYICSGLQLKKVISIEARTHTKYIYGLKLFGCIFSNLLYINASYNLGVLKFIKRLILEPILILSYLIESFH